MRTETIKAITEIVKSIQPTDGTKYALLTPDDILTLRLLQTNWIRIRMSKNIDKRLDYDFDKALETLNRILKQVG